MLRFGGGVLPAVAVGKTKSIFQTRFPLVHDAAFHEDDSAAAFNLTDRFCVRLRSRLGEWFVELDDREEPMDPLHFRLPLVKAGILDADAMRDVVCRVSEITAERVREQQEMQRIRSAFF
jgi:hypothetical protein